jgi:hypothetical protein
MLPSIARLARARNAPMVGWRGAGGGRGNDDLQSAIFPISALLSPVIDLPTRSSESRMAGGAHAQNDKEIRPTATQTGS